MIRRTHLQQGSAELDEVREAIGLRPAAPAANWPDPGEPASGTATPSLDTAGWERYPADSLSGRVRRVLAALTIVSAGVALTHQMLAGALASAHGAGPGARRRHYWRGLCRCFSRSLPVPTPWS